MSLIPPPPLFNMTSLYLLIVDVKGYWCERSQSIIHAHRHSVGLPWTSDQPDAEISI